MDNSVLTPCCDAWRRDLVGSVLGDVVQIDSRRFAMRFSTPPFPRLCMALHPDLSSAWIAPRAPTPATESELAGVLTGALEGTRLSALRKEPEERVVEIDFEGEADRRATVVLELLGKASNLLLLDRERRIVRFVRGHAGAFRRPQEGAIYVRPPRRAAEGEGAPAAIWGSRLLAREIEARAARGEGTSEALRAIERRLADAAWEPTLYTPSAPETVVESEALTPATCFVAPFPLEIGRGLVATPFASMNDAAAAHAGLVLRHLLFRDLHGALAALVKAGITRAERLVTTLEAEVETARGAEAARRRGELILASLGSARKTGDVVEVTDWFDPATPRVEIPIDPRLDLRANAESLFRRARKLERAAVTVARRLEETRSRLAALSGFAGTIDAATGTSEIERIEAELNRSGLVRAIRPPERRELGRRPAFVSFREYRTSDGYQVLVGRGSSENDRLTFRIAAPNDFWFHAAGRPGAHVVVRNPRRARELPETAVREAAAIAAYFSRGDRDVDVDVHWTRRKEVRKGKGMSPGMVMLRTYRVVRVRPGLPVGAAEPTDGVDAERT